MAPSVERSRAGSGHAGPGGPIGRPCGGADHRARRGDNVVVSPSIAAQRRCRVVIIGGGPGGYEAALVAAQLGADVTVVDSDGLGGACVLTDCVPSKTLIETSNAMTMLNRAPGLGIATGGLATVNAARLYERITDLARAQSQDITARLAAEDVRVIAARGRLTG